MCNGNCFTSLVMGEMEGVMEHGAVSWLLLALVVAWSSAHAPSSGTEPREG